MNTCPHCHIRVGGDTAYCPLCQNRLSGPAGEPYFPATAPRIHRASLLYKIVAFVLSALIVVAGAFDFLLMEDTPHRHFSILMAVWAVAVLRVVRAVLRRRFNGRGRSSICCCSSRRCSSLPTGSTATRGTAWTSSCRFCAVQRWSATLFLPSCAAALQQTRSCICS